ncbi:MAG: AAA family ATPase [bacterium]|nr:AAA family ATPase [bacterium]
MDRNVLILYSDNDEPWLKRLRNQIDVLVKSGGFGITIDLRSEKDIESNENWYPDLEPLMDKANLIILMVSDAFLSSPLMQYERVKERLKRKQRGGFPIFLISLYKSGWRRFSWMKNLPVWPGGGKYLSDLKESAAERELSDVAERTAMKLKLKTPISEGLLAFLGLKWVGPAKDLVFEPAKRLNVISGNNGYGKTFLLENALWALTGDWFKYTTLPRENPAGGDATIDIQLMTRSGTRGEIESVKYDSIGKYWPGAEDGKNASALVVYARIDGSFEVWDPVRGKSEPPPGFGEPESPLKFSSRDILFSGIDEINEKGRKRQICNGLITDWGNWQQTADSPFNVLASVLEIFAGSQAEPLIPGPLVNIPGDSRLMPSLTHSYGNVPVIHAASSVQRIVSLAYLLVLTWVEHKKACKGNNSYKNMVVLIDEIESHLHPQWQRTIIPALLEVQKYLDDELEIQFLVTTHSPMVMASLEPVFDDERDKLFHLELEIDEIVLKEYPYLKQGRVDNWFTSDVFGLAQARSLEAEEAIEDANSIQHEEKPDPGEVLEIHKRLTKYLGSFDTFWHRWVYFAEKIIGKNQI